MKKSFEVTSETTVFLTVENIDDIMVSALEGGITYWCDRAKVDEEKRCGAWGHEQIARGGALLLREIDSSNEWELTRGNFLLGFKKWLESDGDKYGAVYDGKVDCGKIDGPAADCIIQYALFGELIFG